MNKEELQMLGFELVAYSGDARSSLLKLLKEVRGGEFAFVESLLKNAEDQLLLAHKAQTKVLAEEASGNEMELGFIFIHGQDHLMTTILLKELILDFIELYKKSSGLNNG